MKMSCNSKKSSVGQSGGRGIIPAALVIGSFGVGLSSRHDEKKKKVAEMTPFGQFSKMLDFVISHHSHDKTHKETRDLFEAEKAT